MPAASRGQFPRGKPGAAPASAPAGQAVPAAAVARRLGAAVRECRKARRLTQETVAERAGLSTNYVGNIERGEYDATVAVLQRVALAMDVRVSSLLADAGL